MGYIYQADVYCEDCGKEIRARLKAEGKAPEDELDHYSYDSYDYPKDADVEREESDSPQHCSSCHEFLFNPLTSRGYQYVKGTLDESKATAKLGLSDIEREWANWYGFTYWDAEDCADKADGRSPGWYSNESY